MGAGKMDGGAIASSSSTIPKGSEVKEDQERQKNERKANEFLEEGIAEVEREAQAVKTMSMEMKKAAEESPPCYRTE